MEYIPIEDKRNFTFGEQDKKANGEHSFSPLFDQGDQVSKYLLDSNDHRIDM